MEPLPIAIAAAAGYLLGALPFGVIVARLHGVDIFKEGSGNPGATNVKRVVGKRAGNTVFALDFLKGFVAAGWPMLVEFPQPDARVWLGLLGLAAAILGHSYSVFIGFRGGKGVAAMLGGSVALMPVAALAAALVWVVLFYSTRYVSVGSIGMAVALPLVAFLRHGPGILFWFALVLGLFVIFRHRENIGRLLRGTENRFPTARERAAKGQHE
ncbi:MAG: glycerol-3-phosphate 1-O-acyltransferase [Verrucomicrobia bacterium]|nr:MAG: glycerol-3-phosphate 1-O-acyltransferase [Verrucomicrobiota bacterium]